jgi:hypothetical protein
MWAACLALGTSTHLITIFQHGWDWDYGGMPVFTRVFWTSLTVLDPLAALFLFLRPRFGVVATAAIIIADVAHNTWVIFGLEGGRGNLLFLDLQAAFLAFVAVTFSFAWREAVARRGRVRPVTAPRRGAS